MHPGMMGKSHLASALGYASCPQGHSVLFTTAIDAINNLVAAQAAHPLKAELNRYRSPARMQKHMGFSKLPFIRPPRIR